MKNIDYTKTLEALNGLKVETGSLACLGCGYEHHCSTNGCAILRDAERHLVLAQATQNFLQCSNCEYWSRNDPRCMCDKSPYAGHTVRPDNYCSCISVDMVAASEEARSDLARQLAAARKQVDELTSAQAVMVKQFDEKLEELAQVKAERSWISIKDRLPEEDGRYLVTECVGNMSFMSVAKYTHKYHGLEEHLLDRAIWYDYDSEYGDFEKTGITHWMPLPEPQEKEM